MSARPIISAPAVEAVRRGFRDALSRPSRPGTPNSASAGRPSTAAAGPAKAGLRVLIPTNDSTAPSPSSTNVGTVSRPAVMPAASAVTPAANTTPARGEAPAQAGGAQLEVVGQRGHRGDPARPQRGGNRRDHRHA